MLKDFLLGLDLKTLNQGRSRLIKGVILLLESFVIQCWKIIYLCLETPFRYKIGEPIRFPNFYPFYVFI